MFCVANRFLSCVQAASRADLAAAMAFIYGRLLRRVAVIFEGACVMCEVPRAHEVQPEAHVRRGAHTRDREVGSRA